MAKVTWTDYMHEEWEEFPYNLGVVLWGHAWENGFSWETAPDVGSPLYEIGVLLETDTETGETTILEFRDGERIFRPISESTS
jgi:hypothetical protein